MITALKRNYAGLCGVVAELSAKAHSECGRLQQEIRNEESNIILHTTKVAGLRSSVQFLKTNIQALSSRK